jgi:biotin synthase
MLLTDIIKKAETTHKLTKDEIVELLKSNGHDAELFAAADRVRKQFVGDEVHLRGLIEFTNCCSQNCLYCGLRRDNTKLERYRLEPDTIIEFASKAAADGYKTVVLQAGEGDFYTLEEMLRIIKSIKALDVAITLSIGEKTQEEYRAYRDAGADRYLLRIETTDKKLYEKMSPGMIFENRVRCLHDLKELGYELGTGCLVGLPGQTLESLADDILFFKELGADMIGVGPFIPNPDTPLGDATGGTFELSLKVMAITRLLMPDINIPATTAMEALNENGRMLGLQSGANVIMPNVTEGDYRRLYALYPGKICVGDTPAHCKSCVTSRINSIGRSVSQGYGYRKKAAV